MLIEVAVRADSLEELVEQLARILDGMSSGSGLLPPAENQPRKLPKEKAAMPARRVK
jgi:hypothetical protein